MHHSDISELDELKSRKMDWSAARTEANTVFAQSSMDRATLGPLSQPLGDCASAVPFGCRKYYPFTARGKMKQINIFYSWQSDLPHKTNKGLIEEALELASAEFRSAGTEISIDADTREVSGSPLIAEVIAAKIRSADLFVADLS